MYINNTQTTTYTKLGTFAVLIPLEFQFAADLIVVRYDCASYLTLLF
nr:MAG TPA: hypothetical protein [Caudoviricetes sp.]